MGAFNELLVEQDGREIAIQFKAGERWQHRYRLGDAIAPGFEDLSGTVVTSGIAGGAGGAPWRYFSITLVDGVLQSYREIDEAAYELLD